MRSRIAIWLAVALLVGAAVACSSSGGPSTGGEVSPAGESPTRSAQASQDLTQTVEGGGVAVEVTWVTSDYLSSWGSAKAKEYGIEKYVLLLVKLDTHSGELGRYDLVEVASLRLEGGEYRPAAWEAIDDTSHHREGILVFPRQAPDGTALDVGPVEVVVRGIAGVPERIFRWELAPDVSGG